MEDCPFCGEVLKENRTLKEGKLAYAILSNPRLMPGHVLVIPRRHVEKISELTKDEYDEIFNLLVEFQAKIITKLSSGCDMRQNFKPYLENSRTHVDHVHFHLLPREVNDELQEAEKSRMPMYRDLPDEEKQKLVSLLS